MFAQVQFKKCNPSEALESSQRCFLGAQTRKHLLRKQNVSGKKIFPQQMFHMDANWEPLTETRFDNNVNSFTEAFIHNERI